MTVHAMTKEMTKDRLAEIRRAASVWPDPPSGFSALAIRDLLAEVDRRDAMTGPGATDHPREAAACDVPLKP